MTERDLLLQAASAYLHAFADGYRTGKAVGAGEMPPTPEVETALWLWTQGSPALSSLAEDALRKIVLSAAGSSAPGAGEG